MFSSRSERLNQARIFSRAAGVRTIVSQSRDGPRAALLVTISTMSPEASLWSSGMMRPFTFAPMVRWPTSVWMRYAKSIGVAPAGSAFTSPFGVKTKTSSWKTSTLSDSTNSCASATSCCHSRSCRTHASFDS